MAIGEFRLITDYFSHQSIARDDVVIGIGDDGAVVEVAAGQQLVLVMDTLVAGVHFPHGTAAADVGWKALAVNLSDLAAMGAAPAWATLALTLPDSDPAWVGGFAAGMFELATLHNLQLIGGDTTAGPLTVTVQAHGLIPRGAALLRRGAKVGDAIYVSGHIGDAGLALERVLAGEGVAEVELLQRLNRPTPRLALGIGLRGHASACIDVSDGLLADLGHILEESGVGATVQAAATPLSPLYRRLRGEAEAARLAAMSAGDDYELLFTAASAEAAYLARLADELQLPLTRIGSIEAQAGLRVVDAAGRPLSVTVTGYQHFAESER